MYDFNSNAQAAKIQGLSVQAGELFADVYRDKSASPETVENALEAYKSLRRMLPREGSGNPRNRHVGATAAHAATQGDLIPRYGS